MRKLLFVIPLLALTGCGAAVDLAVVSGAVTVASPFINNNPNARSRVVNNQPRCSYVKSANLIVVDVCPPGIKEGSRIYK